MQKLKPKWIALRGTAVFEDGFIRQEAPEPKKQGKRAASKAEGLESNEQDDMTTVLLRSDIVFEDGEISCEAWLDHPSNKIQFRLGSTEKVVTFVGINLRGGAFGIVQRDLTTKSDLTAQDIVSPDSPPPIGKWIPLHISVQGSLVELYVDGIRVSRIQAQIARAPLELALQGYGKSQVRNITVSAKKPQAFVVMQFTDDYNQLFREVIQPVCMEFGYEVLRADNIYTNTLIVEDIAKSIREASLVIADITPNNPNVYYEVGFAHGIQKPTILLSDRKREKLPFDISGFRLLFYDNTIGGKSEVEAALRKHLTALRA